MAATETKLKIPTNARGDFYYTILDEKDRELMLLRFVEGRDPKDIAIMYSETANVISVRINRATKRLQSILRI